MDTDQSTDLTIDTDSTTIALVTGATRGIGRETVRRLAGLGWTVWLGARDVEQGGVVAAEIMSETAAETAGSAGTAPADVRAIALDVTDDASVGLAVRRIEQECGRLDVLVNNAGIAGTRSAPRDTSPTDFIPVFGVNVLGPVRTTGAFLPLLDRSARPRVVMVSSGMGSFGVTSDPDRIESTIAGLVYPSSKAALNMIASHYAKSLPGYQVLAVDPGYTSTGLNGFSGPQTVQEGAESTVLAATVGPGAPSGTFTHRGEPLPW
ncbi:SDR family NAD(P)-dependent oxidoreductase [Cellulosimicrobium terreum]|nr:SDR family NAD(P)-dependent oxidoreductase [Cellulosimicrobium terreum]